MKRSFLLRHFIDQTRVAAFFIAGIFLFICFPAFAGAKNIDAEALTQDFMRVVMSAEFGGNTRFGRSVKKYDSSVRFFVINHAKTDRRQQVRSFIWSLPEKIQGLQASVVSEPEMANFRIHIVDHAQYSDVIRHEIYKKPGAVVRGKCFVHVLANDEQNALMRTDVVIVSDLGERTFNRCLVEEVLQGLGPLADRGNPEYSVFNTASQHSSFTVHDQILMNALYDPRIKPGMSKAKVRTILPQVIRDSIARMKSF